MTTEVADWVVFIQTDKGVVSLFKGLTRGEAIQVARRATPFGDRPEGWMDTYGFIRGAHGYFGVPVIDVFRGTGETAPIWAED